MGGYVRVAMSQVRPDERRRAPRGIFRAALLCLGATVFGLPIVAFGQQVGALRGEVSENDISNEILGSPLDQQTTGATQDEQGIPTPEYQPTSEGATPDTSDLSNTGPNAESAPRSLFSDTESPLLDEKTPTPTGRPTTAQEREEQRRRRIAGPESTADEQEAERRRRMQAAEENQDPDTAGTVRAPTVDSQEEPDRMEPDSEREEAIEGLDQEPEVNPYAPVGIQVGTFNVVTTLESGLTWTDNALSAPNGSDALLSESTLRLNALSEEGGDRTSFDAYGNFRKTISGEEIEETRARLDGALERDLGGDWKALAALGYQVGPESASAPDAIEGVLEQPIVNTFDGSLGIEKDVGKLQLRLTGNVERQIYGDANLSTGGTVSQSDRDFTLGTLVLRTGYEISPTLAPFVEFEYGQRIYDEDVDANGFARSATRTGARAGLAFNLGEKFSGEASAGWINEDIEDERLAAVSGPTVAAAIVWSPWRGTLVNFDGTTLVEGATGDGESGSLLYSGRVTVSREMRANLTGDLGFGAAYRDYFGQSGSDVILNADAGMTWWLNRYAGLSGKYRYEELTSTLPDRDYTTNSVFLGLKLQK